MGDTGSQLDTFLIDPRKDSATCFRSVLWPFVAPLGKLDSSLDVFLKRRVDSMALSLRLLFLMFMARE